MRYVIMANGQGARWGNHLGISKHLIEVDGETLLARTTRILHGLDPEAEVIISSSNSKCETDGATRHVPKRNELEIDRFVPELVCEDMCFLYGDTFYTPDALSKVVDTPAESLLFFGNDKTIFAVKVADPQAMMDHFNKVRTAFLEGRLDACKGWQVYYSYAEETHSWKPDELLEGADSNRPDFVLIDDDTGDFNTPEDWDGFSRKAQA